MAAADKQKREDPRKAGAAMAAQEQARKVNAEAEARKDAAAASRRRVAVKDDADDEMVTVTVPHAFKLQVGPGFIVDYPAGVQEMPRGHAQHPYSRDCGVTVYTAGK